MTNSKFIRNAILSSLLTLVAVSALDVSPGEAARDQNKFFSAFARTEFGIYRTAKVRRNVNAANRSGGFCKVIRFNRNTASLNPYRRVRADFHCRIIR